MNDEQEIIKMFDSTDDAGLRDQAPSVYAQHMLSIMKPADGASILELACGNGKVAQYIKSLRPNLAYACMDICSTLTQQARELNPGMAVYTGNCLNKIPPGTYDIIMSWRLLQYLSVSEYINLNRMMVHHLKPRGQIWHFSTPDNTKRWKYGMAPRKTVFSKLKGVVKHLLDSPKRHYGPASIWHDPMELLISLDDRQIQSTIFQPGDVNYCFHIRVVKRKG